MSKYSAIIVISSISKYFPRILSVYILVTRSKMGWGLNFYWTAPGESSSACLQRPCTPQLSAGAGEPCKLSALSAVLSLPLWDQHTGRAWGNGFGLQEFVFQDLDWKTRLGKSNISTVFESRHFNRENRAFYKNILANLLDTIWTSKKYQYENKHIFHMLTVSNFDSVSFKLEAKCGEQSIWQFM